MKADDVLGMLGIEKTDDMLELEKKKSETMMSAVNKIASLLTRKKSPAELSKTKWTAVAKVYRQGKLTFEAWQFVEEGGDMSTFGQPRKRVSWCSAKFDVDAGSRQRFGLNSSRSTTSSARSRRYLVTRRASRQD